MDLHNVKATLRRQTPDWGSDSIEMNGLPSHWILRGEPDDASIRGDIKTVPLGLQLVTSQRHGHNDKSYPRGPSGTVTGGTSGSGGPLPSKSHQHPLAKQSFYLQL